MRIGLLSDTHGYLDEKVFEYFADCDEIWHAGDIGTLELAQALEAFKPLRAVYGNIDDGTLQYQYPKDQIFELDGIKIWITHIGGYPGRYASGIKKILTSSRPDIFICGHSHILKVMPDKALNLLHINPGAAGRHGFHVVRTLVKFDLKDSRIQDLKVIELGLRGS